MYDAHTPKDLSFRVHSCPSSSYTKRDLATFFVIRKRGFLAINADGQSLVENACGDGKIGDRNV